MSVTTDNYRLGMRHLPAAVSVLATGRGDQRAGLTATAVMSLTAEPPRIVCAVNQSASAYPALLENRTIGVNVLAGEQEEVASCFAGATGLRGAERFTAGDWREMSTGAPILDGAVVNFDCTIVDHLPFDSHSLFICAVQEVAVSPDRQPLLFVDGGWAGLMRASEEHLGQYRQAVEESVAAVTEALAAGRSPTEQLRRFVENFTHVNIAQSDVTREYLRHEAYVPQEAMVAINAAKDEFDRQLAGLLRAGVESGEFEVRDPRLAGLAISGMVSWMYRWYSEQGRLAPDDVAQEMADLVLGMVSGR